MISRRFMMTSNAEMGSQILAGTSWIEPVFHPIVAQLCVIAKSVPHNAEDLLELSCKEELLLGRSIQIEKSTVRRWSQWQSRKLQSSRNSRRETVFCSRPLPMVSTM